MNKYTISILLLFTMLITLGCKSDTQPKVKSSNVMSTASSLKEIPSGIRIIKNMGDKLNDASLDKMVTDATSILAHRVKESSAKSWQILTSRIYEYEFIFGGSTTSKPGELKGRWVDFKDDLTYSYGYFENVNGSGKYHYSPDTDLLLMVDNDRKIKPNEYKVKFANDVAIFIGTSTYKDNNFQGKLNKIDELPKTSSSE